MNSPSKKGEQLESGTHAEALNGINNVAGKPVGASASTLAVPSSATAGSASPPCVTVEAVGFRDGQTSFVRVSIGAGLSHVLIDCSATPWAAPPVGGDEFATFVKLRAPMLLSDPREDFACIDTVLITSFQSFAALPLLLQRPELAQCRVFATAPALQLGRLHLENLLETAALESTFPQCFAAAAGACNTSPLSCGFRLYEFQALQQSLSRVEVVSYGETVIIDGRLSLTALASGASVGGAIWVVHGVVPPVLGATSKGQPNADSECPLTLRLVLANQMSAVTKRLARPLDLTALRTEHNLLVMSGHASHQNKTAAAAGFKTCDCRQSGFRSSETATAGKSVQPPQARPTKKRSKTRSAKGSGYAACFSALCADVSHRLRRGHTVVLPVMPAGGFFQEFLHHLRGLGSTVGGAADGNRDSHMPAAEKSGSVSSAKERTPLATCPLIFVGKTLFKSVSLIDTLSEWTTRINTAAADLSLPVSEQSQAADGGMSWDEILGQRQPSTMRADSRGAQSNDERFRQRFVFARSWGAVWGTVCASRRFNGQNNSVRQGYAAAGANRLKLGSIVFVEHRPSLHNRSFLGLCRFLCLQFHHHCGHDAEPSPGISVAYTHLCPGASICGLQRELSMLSQACARTRFPIEVSHHPISAELSVLQVKKLCGVAKSAVQVLVSQASLSCGDFDTKKQGHCTPTLGLPAKRKVTDAGDQPSDGMRVSKCDLALEALSSGFSDVPCGPLVHGWVHLDEDLPQALLEQGSISERSKEQPREELVELRTKNYQTVVCPISKPCTTNTT